MLRMALLLLVLGLASASGPEISTTNTSLRLDPGENRRIEFATGAESAIFADELVTRDEMQAAVSAPVRSLQEELSTLSSMQRAQAGELQQLASLDAATNSSLRDDLLRMSISTSNAVSLAVSRQVEEGSVAAGRVSSLNSTLQSALQRLAQFELCAALGLLPAASGCRPPAQVEVSQGTALVCNASRQGALRQPTVNGPLEVCSSGGWMVVVPGVSSAVSALASNFTTLSATVSGLARNVSLVSGVVDALTANVSALTPRREAGPRTLAIANYRLYFDTAVAGSCFTNFRLQVAGMAALPAFMAGENIRGSTNRVFVNLGGAAVWSVDAPAGSAVTLEANNVYRDDGRLVNDANGVPEMILANVGSVIVNGTTNLFPASGCDMNGGTCFIPVDNLQTTAAPAFQRIRLTGAAGRFVVLAPYRLRVHLASSQNFVRSFLTCDNCKDMGNANPSVSNARMLIENVGVRAGNSFNNVGGFVAWVIEKNAGDANIDVRYTAAYQRYTTSFVDDDNGRITAQAFRCPGFCNFDSESSTAGVVTLPTGLPGTFHQSVTVPSNAQYLTISNHRIRHDPGAG